MPTENNVVSQFFPEVGISGYTSVDGTVEFYGRINSILDSSMTVLDYGAGRAAWYFDDPCQYRKNLRLIKGKVRLVIGADIDSAVLENESVDKQIVFDPMESLPIEEGTIDMIIADYTFEHIDNAETIAREFDRMLKAGGWICARTPNKYSYVALFTRLISNSFHTRLLRWIQPDRKEIDIFPTTFELNSIRDLDAQFSRKGYENLSYRFEAEPAYHFNNKLIFRIMLILNKMLPSICKSNLFIFLKKK